MPLDFSLYRDVAYLGRKLLCELVSQSLLELALVLLQRVFVAPFKVTDPYYSLTLDSPPDEERHLVLELLGFLDELPAGLVPHSNRLVFNPSLDRFWGRLLLERVRAALLFFGSVDPKVNEGSVDLGFAFGLKGNRRNSLVAVSELVDKVLLERSGRYPVVSVLAYAPNSQLTLGRV